MAAECTVVAVVVIVAAVVITGAAVITGAVAIVAAEVIAAAADESSVSSTRASESKQEHFIKPPCPRPHWVGGFFA